MTSEMLPQTSDMAQVLAGPEGDFLRRALEQMLRQIMAIRCQVILPQRMTSLRNQISPTRQRAGAMARF